MQSGNFRLQETARGKLQRSHGHFYKQIIKKMEVMESLQIKAELTEH